MNDQPRPVARRPKMRLLLTIALIAIGLAIAAFFGVRSVRSFRQLQYIHQQGLDRGTASVDAIRPWMTIRFIAVAYAVPEEYLYSALAIPFERRNADQSLGELNRIYQLGLVPNSTEPVIMERARAAITEYRKNPVATGLHDVRPWMSIRYIANSTGIAEGDIFAAIGLPAAGNENKPLDLISREQHYPGGPRALVEAVQRVLTQQKATP
ncbi:MAG: hypothetical protein ACJ8CR_08625 [Roseiflexaceae bacterium]